MDEYNKASNEIHDTIADMILGHIPYVIYSAGEYDENDIPINNLREIAIKGKCILRRGIYQSMVLEDPNWLMVCVYADEAIVLHNDFDHVFLEGVFITDEMIDDVPVYSMHMGS